MLNEYADQLPITLRQIYYRLIGAHGYDKDGNAAERLGEIVNRARRAKLIPMDAIRDDGGAKAYPRHGAMRCTSCVTVRQRHRPCSLTAPKASRFA